MLAVYTPTITSGTITLTLTTDDPSGPCPFVSDQVVLTVNPIATVNAGIDQTICAGGTVTLAGVIGGSAAVGTWSAASGSFSSSTSMSSVYTPTITSGTITLTLTTDDPSGPCPFVSDQVVLTVNPLPNVDAGLDQEICAGSSISLIGNGANSYDWDNNITNGVSFIPITSITFTLTGTSIENCTNTDQVIVTVNPLPNIDAGANQILCAGELLTLNASGAITYSWDNSATNNNPFTPALGNTLYTVTGTDANFCVQTDQVEVQVNPLPLIDAGTDTAICAGSEVILIGSGNAVLTWSNNVVSGTPFIPTATSTYTLTGVSALGCTNSDQVVVTINPIPAVNAGADISICAGQDIILNASGASSYAWSNSIVNGVPFLAITGTYSYTVAGTSAFGCINTDAISVIVSDATTPTFTPNITSGCVPLTVEFTNTSPNIASCTWEFGNGTQVTGPGLVSATFDQSACFDVTLTTTSVNGCVSTYTAIDLICTDGSPEASFIQSTAAISELNSTVSFSNTSTGASSYIWNFGDNTASVFTEDPTHTFSTDQLGSSTTILIAISPAGCADTAYSNVTIYEELIYYIPNTFTPDGNYSNPVFLPIFTSGFDPFDFTLTIYNRWGGVVFESHDVKIGWDGTFGSNGEIDSVQDGTYSWKIEFKSTASDERIKFFGHVNVLR
jgi:PKD repeat protein